MTTTIKVDNELRDRLKAQAAESGISLGQHLRVLYAKEARARRMAALAEAINRTSAADMASWREEMREWEKSDLTDFAALNVD